MDVKSQEHRPVASEEDIVRVRESVKRIVSLLNFSLVNQTKTVTAASELSRNVLEHGHGGDVTIQLVDNPDRNGIRLIFADTGPGIPDIARAMEDGYTTGRGMGLGLGGSRRLMDEFEIESTVEKGTRITCVKWADR